MKTTIMLLGIIVLLVVAVSKARDLKLPHDDYNNVYAFDDDGDNDSDDISLKRKKPQHQETNRPCTRKCKPQTQNQEDPIDIWLQNTSGQTDDSGHTGYNSEGGSQNKPVDNYPFNYNSTIGQGETDNNATDGSYNQPEYNYPSNLFQRPHDRNETNEVSGNRPPYINQLIHGTWQGPGFTGHVDQGAPSGSFDTAENQIYGSGNLSSGDPSNHSVQNATESNSSINNSVNSPVCNCPCAYVQNKPNTNNNNWQSAPNSPNSNSEIGSSYEKPVNNIPFNYWQSKPDTQTISGSEGDPEGESTNDGNQPNKTESSSSGYNQNSSSSNMPNNAGYNLNYPVTGPVINITITVFNNIINNGSDGNSQETSKVKLRVNSNENIQISNDMYKGRKPINNKNNITVTMLGPDAKSVTLLIKFTSINADIPEDSDTISNDI